MKKLIQAIIDKWFCKHDWDVDRTTSHFYEGETIPYQIDTVIVCTKCGRRGLETTL